MRREGKRQAREVEKKERKRGRKRGEEMRKERERGTEEEEGRKGDGREERSEKDEECSGEGGEKPHPPLLCLGDNLLPPGVHLCDPPLQARWGRAAGDTSHPASSSRQLLPLKCLQRKTTCEV